MIECTKFKSHEKGCLQGFADFYISKWGIEIKGCSLYSKNGAAWITFPGKEYEVNGEKKYAQSIYFKERSHKEEFDKQAKLAIARFCENNQNTGAEG